MLRLSPLPIERALQAIDTLHLPNWRRAAVLVGGPRPHQSSTSSATPGRPAHCGAAFVLQCDRSDRLRPSRRRCACGWAVAVAGGERQFTMPADLSASDREDVVRTVQKMEEANRNLETAEGEAVAWGCVPAPLPAQRGTPCPSSSSGCWLAGWLGCRPDGGRQPAGHPGRYHDCVAAKVSGHGRQA